MAPVKRKSPPTPPATPVKRQKFIDKIKGLVSAVGSKVAYEALDAISPGAGAAAAIASIIGPRDNGGTEVATIGQKRVTKKMKKAAGVKKITKSKKRNAMKKKKTMKRKNTKLTAKQIEQKGTTMVEEIRWKTKINTENNRTEAIAIAHTSMPVKVSVLNACRALMKYVWIAMGIKNIDYSRDIGGYGIKVGEKIVLYYYEGYNQTAASNIIVDLQPQWSFDFVAYQLSLQLNSLSFGALYRWESIVFIPVDTGKFSNVNLELTGLKIAVHTRTEMKVQNRSVTELIDDEADDVDNVPVQGALFVTKGNNFLRKSNSVLLKGVVNAADETVCYRSWTKNQAVVVGNADYSGGPADGNQGPVIKPAEIPKKHEICGCLSVKKFTILPGQIRKSIIDKTYSMSLVSYLTLLVSTRGGVDDTLVYSPRLGFTNTLYLEKVIGDQNTDVRIATETEFRQSAYVYGKQQNLTLPLTTQLDITEA